MRLKIRLHSITKVHKSSSNSFKNTVKMTCFANTCHLNQRFQYSSKSLGTRYK